jgi:hypothetical protein
MRVLVFATTLGADLLSFVHHLHQQSGYDIRILVSDRDTFLREPINRIRPLDVPLIERKKWHHFLGSPFFHPDVTIMDNKLPLRRLSEKAFILWHGYGWKGPNDRVEFAWLHKQMKATWGDMTIPNPDMIWQCFGEPDFKHRSEISGFHPTNLRILGSASHDDLKKPLDRALLQPYYPFDVVHRKTVLFAPTWHYGEVFAHWGKDAALFDRLIQHLHAKNTNIILRLHDSFRFPPDYVRFLEALAGRYSNLMLKFKDRNPDNFLDMQVSDVMLTNFSSIANLFYATGRPTVHLYPVKSEDEAFMWRKNTIFGVKTEKVESVKFIWKYNPEENGGFLARNFDDMISQTETSLADPGSCRTHIETYFSKHMVQHPGGNCTAIQKALEHQVNG